MASEQPRLALYHDDHCPFTLRVEAAISQLGLDVERRNIDRDPRYYRELEAARGRTTVPVLRIEESGGGVRWLPESLDIVRYLRTVAGVEASVPVWIELIAERATTLTLIFLLSAYLTEGAARVGLGLAAALTVLAWLAANRPPSKGATDS